MNATTHTYYQIRASHAGAPQLGAFNRAADIVNERLKIETGAHFKTKVAALDVAMQIGAEMKKYLETECSHQGLESSRWLCEVEPAHDHVVVTARVEIRRRGDVTEVTKEIDGETYTRTVEGELGPWEESRTETTQIWIREKKMVVVD